MEMVMKYLNENIHLDKESKVINEIGGCFGHWKIHEKLSCNINNKTISFRSIYNSNGNIPLYSYLQTYSHIERGEPDKWGYYARSTEEEIIKYIKEQIKHLLSLSSVG